MSTAPIQFRINVDSEEFRQNMRNLSEVVNRAGFSTGELRQVMQSMRGPMMVRGTEYRHQGRGEGPRVSDLHGHSGIVSIPEPPTVPCVLAPPNRKIMV